MVAIKTEVKGYLIMMDEETQNKKVYGRSVYNIRIEHPEHGMFIIGIGDDLDEALLYHTAYTNKAMKGEKPW